MLLLAIYRAWLIRIRLFIAAMGNLTSRIWQRISIINHFWMWLLILFLKSLMRTAPLATKLMIPFLLLKNKMINNLIEKLEDTIVWFMCLISFLTNFKKILQSNKLARFFGALSFVSFWWVSPTLLVYFRPFFA